MTAPLASIEGVEHFAENVVFVIAQGKQGHARLQFQVVGVAEDLSRRFVGVSQHQSRAFDEPGAEYRVVQVFPCLLHRIQRVILSVRACSEPLDLRENKPHPVFLFFARFQF